MNAIKEAIRNALETRLGDDLVPDHYDTVDELNQAVDAHYESLTDRHTDEELLARLDEISYEVENDWIYLDSEEPIWEESDE